MADHSNGSGEGEVVDCVEDRGGPKETQMSDRTTVEEATGVSVVVAGGGDGRESQQQEVGDEEKDRATEVNPRARVLSWAVWSIPAAKGPGTVVEGPPMVGDNSGGVGTSRALGDVPRPNGSPPGDPVKGKSAVITEEEEPTEEEHTTEAASIEIREEDIAFRPPVTAATSSRHTPITFDDIAEHTPDKILAKLLEERPDIGEIVLKSKEDRARAIESAEAAERAE
ncbi:hypothetical protein RHMOL_Rhmol09G0102700 [Rhododendron molle]|uniref:Uncharacterized protein n=1 Tax=Rhododendron molle TaxID=49168 RepID=A0ACC0MBU5_RHOML|nr:hypothetical protein RHMOL_Rhmol09G0102700 [Rhododendron molle]